MAATKNLTDYERKRLENIRRNEELMSSLKLQSMATQLSSATKRHRAIWGWDDAYIFIGNKRRGVDVISPLQRTVFTLESPNIYAIPVRFAAHPYNVGMLAAGTDGGQVYVWTEG